MNTVFLSYSSIDRPIARKLAADLQNAGFEVWFDEWQIRVGDSISQKISQGLSDSTFVLVLLSVASVSSGWVEKEWQSKIGNEADARNVSILPIRVEECPIPVLLRDKRYADIGRDYPSGLADLVDSLRHHFETLREDTQSRLGEYATLAASSIARRFRPQDYVIQSRIQRLSYEGDLVITPVQLFRDTDEKLANGSDSPYTYLLCRITNNTDQPRTIGCMRKSAGRWYRLDDLHLGYTPVVTSLAQYQAWFEDSWSRDSYRPNPGLNLITEATIEPRMTKYAYVNCLGKGWNGTFKLEIVDVKDEIVARATIQVEILTQQGGITNR